MYAQCIVGRLTSGDADYRYKERDDRYHTQRRSDYDEPPRYGRDDPKGWDRDRERGYYGERDHDHEHRDSRRQPRYRERSMSPPARRPRTPPQSDYEEQMIIDAHHVGMVIGRWGETLRKIERDSAARVQFAPGKLSILLEFLSLT
jgi:hypothetical protein